MNMLYRTTRLLLVVLAAGSLPVACSDDNDTPAPLKLVDGYAVNVLYPDSYAATHVAGATVTLTNLSTSETFNGETNATGTASFSQLLPGNYSISAKRTLTAAEAEPITGYPSELFLNAALASVSISDTASAASLQLTGSAVGGLVFKQIYYTLSKTPLGVNYLQDQFYEIYNNSTDTLYADGLCLGDVHGSAGNSPSSTPSGFQEDQENVYIRAVWRVPGSGKQHPIAPGASVVLAQTAINHNTGAGVTASVDLGTGISDFEAYAKALSRDVDNDSVPDLEPVYLTSPGFYWTTYVFGASMIIFRHPDPGNLPHVPEPNTSNTLLFTQVPVANVIDAVELLANAEAASFKRIPTSLDAGFQYASGTYVGEAVLRKVRSTATNGRKILQDTNNSREDFVVIKKPVPKGW